MHFVGVDLAWGERKPTGLAVLDDAGQLVHLATVMTDEEVLASLEPFTDDECVVAVDAPLVVTNPTGNRPAERALNQVFAAFDAGAHPVNTGRAEFSEQPRGARLAERLGLDLDPASTRTRRAIEVYPHAATISLFRLGRTLKYKQKTGRDLEQLRAELLVLLGLLESLATADPPLRLDPPSTPGAAATPDAWAQLRTSVETARRKSELRVAEDQVDAVVCAYVALFATRRPEETTTFGDAETGAIVTPALPEGHAPAKRGRRRAPAVDPGAAVREYAEQLPALRRATTEWVELVRALLDDAGINYLTVTGRAKSLSSFASKAARTVDGKPVFTDPLRQIHDQVGLRVITYVESDVQAAVDVLTDQVVVHDDRDMGEETASEGRFGYSSRHLQISLDDDRRDAHPGLVDRRAQVQVRTVLQHAWAEFEHDIRYKGTIPEAHVPDLDRRFTLAAGLLELADREFSAIRERLMTTGPADGSADDAGAPSDELTEDPRITPRELAAFLAGQYADAGWSRTDHYAWIGALVLELGITSLRELGEVIRSVDADLLASRMGYRYPPGAVRRLDDALLWTYGDTYVQLRDNSHRVESLRARLARMREE